MLAYRKAKENANFKGSPHRLIEELSAIRLAILLKAPRKKLKDDIKQYIALKKWTKISISLLRLWI